MSFKEYITEDIYTTTSKDISKMMNDEEKKMSANLTKKFKKKWVGKNVSITGTYPNRDETGIVKEISVYFDKKPYSISIQLKSGSYISLTSGSEIEIVPKGQK